MSLQRLPQFDGDNVVSYSASADLPDLPITLAEKREVFAAARRLIQAKYDAGIPLFTKDLFRDVVRQLDSDDTLDQKVSVVGLDGRAVHFPIETGKEFPHRPYGDDYVSIMYYPPSPPTLEPLPVSNPHFVQLARNHYSTIVA